MGQIVLKTRQRNSLPEIATDENLCPIDTVRVSVCKCWPAVEFACCRAAGRRLKYDQGAGPLLLSRAGSENVQILGVCTLVSRNVFPSGLGC